MSFAETKYTYLILMVYPRALQTIVPRSKEGKQGTGYEHAVNQIGTRYSNTNTS